MNINIHERVIRVIRIIRIITEGEYRGLLGLLGLLPLVDSEDVMMRQCVHIRHSRSQDIIIR